MKDYKKLKAADAISWIKTPVGKIIQRRKYDPNTGQPAAPELTAYDEQALLAEKTDNASQSATLTERDDEIDLIIADAKKVK